MLRMGTFTVTSAAYEVGYVSRNQFSREYARKFGHPPKHDVAKGHERAAKQQTSAAPFSAPP